MGGDAIAGRAEILTHELGEWNVAALLANEVISRRLFIILNGDTDAYAELQRAILEKLEFTARWSWIFVAGGWLDLEGSLLQIAREMRAQIRHNRDRLAVA